MNSNYQFGLLNLLHLLIHADGVSDQKESNAFKRIKEIENISDSTLEQFESQIKKMDPFEIYRSGLGFINQCNTEEKLRAFSILFRMSEIDGRVHAKEIRLLIGCLQDASVALDEVIMYTSASPIHL